jgi:hypothetical protein
VTAVTSPVSAFTALVTAITATESGQRAQIPQNKKASAKSTRMNVACYFSSFTTDFVVRLTFGIISNYQSIKFRRRHNSTSAETGKCS